VNKKLLLFIILILFFACKGNIITDDVKSSGGWKKYSGNPILQPGRKTGNTANDYYNLSDCFVIKDDPVYKMWYTSSGATSAGSTNHCNISYATSTDGVSWTKYAGNPVLDLSAGSWDKYAVETVSVLKDTEASPDKLFKMWYAGRTNDVSGNPAYDIGYATSSDGINWVKYAAAVLKKGASSEWDNYFIEGPCVIKEGGAYKMWYAGMDAVANGQVTDGKVSIGYATSSDGINWTKYSGNPVMTTGEYVSWDDVTVQDPHVIKYGNEYHMWYGGKTNDYTNYGQQTGYAVSSNGINWRKSSDNPVFKRGAAGSWDAVTASFGSVLIDNNRIRLWYTGMDKDYNPSIPEYWEIGYAEKNLSDQGVIE
jgi:predicted GH43/DUF377 family glycosyl hydrolase